jgi:hypothetical protein
MFNYFWVALKTAATYAMAFHATADMGKEMTAGS